MKKTKKLMLTFMLITMTLVFFASPVIADAESERANLVRLVAELDYLLQSVRKYQIDPVNDRYTFYWDALSRDINLIRNGITEYINKDLSLAREISPLVGQYIQQPIQQSGEH